ncbi:MAG: hypothetical protein KJ767_01340 [Nanoarchaeota archaeon]|nr:hypothetical protein [Nanoarchaeota archaeon]
MTKEQIAKEEQEKLNHVNRKVKIFRQSIEDYARIMGIPNRSYRVCELREIQEVPLYEESENASDKFKLQIPDNTEAVLEYDTNYVDEKVLFITKKRTRIETGYALVPLEKKI